MRSMFVRTMRIPNISEPYSGIKHELRNFLLRIPYMFLFCHFNRTNTFLLIFFFFFTYNESTVTGDRVYGLGICLLSVHTYTHTRGKVTGHDLTRRIIDRSVDTGYIGSVYACGVS